jgi:hypothetical protein
MGVQVADDRLDEVGCGAVASHVSSPHLQAPTAKAVGKKRREPMKGGRGSVIKEMEPKKGDTGQEDAIQQGWKEVARYGAEICSF